MVRRYPSKIELIELQQLTIDRWQASCGGQTREASTALKALAQLRAVRSADTVKQAKVAASSRYRRSLTGEQRERSLERDRAARRARRARYRAEGRCAVCGTPSEQYRCVECKMTHRKDEHAK